MQKGCAPSSYAYTAAREQPMTRHARTALVRAARAARLDDQLALGKLRHKHAAAKSNKHLAGPSVDPPVSRNRSDLVQDAHLEELGERGTQRHADSVDDVLEAANACQPTAR